MTGSKEKVVCPICGKEAESGAVYSRDGALQWITGKPDWKKRLKTLFSLNQYEIVGEVGVFTASFASGILCRSCQRVILVLSGNKITDYFPYVKK